MKNFIRDTRENIMTMTDEEYNQKFGEFNTQELSAEQTQKIFEIFETSEKEVGKIRKNIFKKGTIEMLKETFEAGLSSPTLINAGCEFVTFDPAEIIDFIEAHRDVEISVLYELTPYYMNCVRIMGLAFNKPVSDEFLSDVTAFSAKLERETAASSVANRGVLVKYNTFIALRWDKAAFSGEKKFLWK